MTRIGLIGLDPLAVPLTRAGFDVISDPDLKGAVAALNIAAREHGQITTLILNSPRVRSLIPRIERHLSLMVLSPESGRCDEAEGHTTYQLPGTLRDICKNAGVEFDDDTFPGDLELDAEGRLVDPTHGWEEWEPDPADPEPTADADAGSGLADATPPPETQAVPAGYLSGSLFGEASALRQSLRGGGPRTGLGQVVLAISGSGGVGKTTTCLGLATRSAARGLRTILVDGSLGQGDCGTYLRVAGANLPTMFDSLLGQGELRSALISATQLNAVRDPHLGPVNFAFLQAPAEDEVRTGRLTAAVVAQLVDAARRLADLVIVDTQIVEADDPRGMVERVIVPLLGAGGWAVAIASLSSAGMANLIRVMEDLRREGVNPSHVLSMLSRIPTDTDFDQDRTSRAFRELSVPIGTAWLDHTIMTAMNRGEMVADSPILAPLYDVMLNRILDLPVQAVAYDPHTSPPRPRSLLARLIRRGA